MAKTDNKKYISLTWPTSIVFVLKGKHPLVLAAFPHSFKESSNGPREADKARVKCFNVAFERQENVVGRQGREEGGTHHRGGERMNTC